MACAIVAVAGVLSACGGNSVSDEELYERAREQNVAFKEAVASVQELVHTGEWKVYTYGATPTGCDGGYRFEMSRALPLPALPPDTDARALADEIAAEMDADGWSDVVVHTYSEGIDHVIVQASHEYVERIDVDINPGKVATGVLIRAESACFEGDLDALRPILNPQWPRGYHEYPTLETPDATPVFGFTEDGQPR